jgi:hypothetical protein
MLFAVKVYLMLSGTALFITNPSNSCLVVQKIPETLMDKEFFP